MPDPGSRPPTVLAEHAAGHLAYIRDTMQRAGRFTAVSGKGTVAAGIIGLLAAVYSPRMAHPMAWLWLWMAAAALALPAAVVLMARKARRAGQSLTNGPARTFALAFAPALLAGALLTAALVRTNRWDLMPGTWLVCYGAGVISGGAFSVRAVPLLGIAFVLLGAIALFASSLMHPWLLGAGFGGAHLLFGMYVMRYHGG